MKNEKSLLKVWRVQINFLSLHSQSGRVLRQKKEGALVQLVRIHACHAWGHGFESRTHRKEKESVSRIPFLVKLKNICKDT